MFQPYSQIVFFVMEYLVSYCSYAVIEWSNLTLTREDKHWTRKCKNTKTVTTWKHNHIMIQKKIIIKSTNLKSKFNRGYSIKPDKIKLNINQRKEWKTTFSNLCAFFLVTSKNICSQQIIVWNIIIKLNFHDFWISYSDVLKKGAHAWWHHILKNFLKLYE